jgi:hypothetical protein
MKRPPSKDSQQKRQEIGVADSPAFRFFTFDAAEV